MMLITSKGTRRWVLPKGGIKPGRKCFESAADEAFEEAGITGQMSRNCIGIYGYQKSDKKYGVHCTVRVYPMKVTAMLPDWPERNERRREWVAFEVASSRVREKDLKKMIRSFHSSLKGRRSAAKAR